MGCGRDRDTGATWWRWIRAWPGLALLGIANGVAREALYARRLGPLRAHQVSTLTLAALLTARASGLARRAPVCSAREARRIGATWAGLTLAFEVAMGRARGLAWRDLLADYDLRRGRVWAAIPLTLALLPSVLGRRRPR